MSEIHKLAEDLFRHESGKMVSVLTRIFGTENLETAEDVVQQTFIDAMNVWKLKGVPANPAAWLYTVARNKTVDVIRKNKHSVRFDFSGERSLLTSEYTLTTTIEELWKDDNIQDDLLRMMYACCHEEISPENQITLILKTLCGFSTIEVARAFLTTEETITKRLYRTKEFFRERKIRPEFPPAEQLSFRTDSVLRSIYLLFNEGYNSTNDSEFIRKDLIRQSLYLCSLLSENKNTSSPETFAAMSLMCFHASRTEERINSEGEIVLLEEQDRAKWDSELIRRGIDFLERSSGGETISSYHIEAAIAFEHSTAPNFASTNWERILALYDLLVKINSSAVVLLNRAAVIYKASGADAALKELNNTKYQKEWEKNYLYHSLLGEINSGIDKSLAVYNFEKAIRLTNSEKEKRLLERKSKRLIENT